MSELRKVFERWAEAEGRLRSDELEIRYQWSRDVNDISERPHEYGQEGTDLLFEAMGISRHQISVYRNVGSRIDKPLVDEIHEFNKRPESKYGRIAWSHLVELSRIADHQMQLHLIRQAAQNRWSVETLRNEVQSRIRAKLVPSANETRKAGAVTIARQLQRSVATFQESILNLESSDFMDGLKRIRDCDLDSAIETLVAVNANLHECLTRASGCESIINEAVGTLRVAPSQAAASGGSFAELSRDTVASAESPEGIPERKKKRPIGQSVNTDPTKFARRKKKVVKVNSASPANPGQPTTRRKVVKKKVLKKRVAVRRPKGHAVGATSHD